MSTTTPDLPTMWLLARSSGLIAYALLTLAVVAGLTLRTRLFGRAVSPALITAVHRTLSTVGLVSVAVHAMLIALDAKVDVPLLALFVPGLSGYRMLATSLGVIALELWVIIHVSFRLRRYIGVKRWRSLHYATFGAWGLAALHGIFAGTDSGVTWVSNLYAASIGLVVLLLVFRSTTGARTAAKTRRAPAPGTPTTPPSVPATRVTPPTAHANPTPRTELQERAS